MGAHRATNIYDAQQHWATLHRIPVVLILQNERFNADFVEQILKTLGFTVGGAFSRSSDAVEWLGDQNPDVAILDAELQDGECAAVARVLNARGIPFVVYSTVSLSDRTVDPALGKGVFLKKPSSRAKILAAIRQGLAMREGN